MDTRFYCDKCGKEVAFNTEVCPNCGEPFDAVKCPVCNLIGKPSQFMNGCPSCGFMNPRQDLASASPSGESSLKTKKKRPGSPGKHKKPVFTIPAYGYRILIALFLGILIILLFLLFRS